MTSTQLLNRLSQLSKSWPRDPIRPSDHLQLSHAIHKNLESLPLDTYDEQSINYAQRAIDSLQSIRDGNESREHPISSSILAPKSDPEYYTRLRKAIEKLEQGGKVGDFTFSQKMKIFFGAKPSQMY
ncbi:unnamed protein product [Sympodiomycopsis kandeliae]